MSAMRYIRTKHFSFIEESNPSMTGAPEGYGYVIAPDPTGKWCNINFSSDHPFFWGGPSDMGRLTLNQWTDLAQQAHRELDEVGGLEFFFSLPYSDSVRYIERNGKLIMVSSPDETLREEVERCGQP